MQCLPNKVCLPAGASVAHCIRAGQEGGRLCANLRHQAACLGDPCLVSCLTCMQVLEAPAVAELARRATQAAQAAPPDSHALAPHVGGAIPHSSGPSSALEVTVSGAELRHLAQTSVRCAESQRDQLCSMDSSAGGSLLQVMLELLQGDAMGGTTYCLAAADPGCWTWSCVMQRLGATATWQVVQCNVGLACDAAGAACSAEQNCWRGACHTAGFAVGLLSCWYCLTRHAATTSWCDCCV